MTATAQRPSTTTAIAQAAQAGTSARPDTGCKDCVKTGLAILPVVPVALPKSVRGANAEINTLDNRLDSKDLQEHWYVMRTLPAGYLYVMKPDLSWDCYLVDSDGLLRMTAPADAPANPSAVQPMSQMCKRYGDNVPAQVVAVDPTKHATVWLAFSRYRWTARVLTDYASNKDGCRDQRMTKLDVMAAAAGSLGASHTAANAVRFGAAMTAQTGQYVADYASGATRELLNAHLATPLRGRGEQGVPLAKKMAEISRNTAGKTGAIICLSDALGNAMDVNMLRNAETGRLGAYLAQNQHKRFVGDIITSFEKAFADSGQGAEWNKRYKPKYNAAKLASDRAEFDRKAKGWEERIDAMSRDVATLNGAPALKAWWHDFDPADDQSAKDRQVATAACLHGAVKTKEEQALWDRWFNESPSDPYATLWGAATALNTDLGAYLFGKQLPDVGKTDKFADIAKNIREGVIRFRQDLQKRAADDALALIGVAMASQLPRLKALNPALYQVAGWRVLMVASARTTITATPTFVAMTHTQEALLLAEAAFGPPQASAKRLLDIEAASSKRVFVVGTNGVDAYAWQGTSTIQEKVRVAEIWLPEELAKDVPALPAAAARAALPPPKVNVFSALVKFTKSTPGAFAWVGLTLQTLNLANSAKDWSDAGVTDKTDAYFGVASGTLGVVGVMGEIAAGAMEKMGARFAATRIAQVAFFGGVLAGLSAIAEGVQAWVKAGQRFSAGDDDAGVSYRRAGFTLFASGLAAIGASLAIASGAGALTGALSFLAGAGAAAATVPVWGWIAAAVLFLGAGLVLLWQAIKNTDTPLEVWLLNGTYGTGSKKLTAQQEMDGVNDLMYAMSIEVEWSEDAWEVTNTNFYDDYDDFKFSITLPGAGADSMIDCKITLIGKLGRKQVFHETIRPRVLGTTVTDPHIAVVSATPAKPAKPVTPSLIWWAPPAIRSGAALSYNGHLKLDDAIYSSAEVEIQYWPDQKTMPNFVLPKALDQRTLTAKD
jgi:hypothetical protein